MASSYTEHMLVYHGNEERLPACSTRILIHMHVAYSVIAADFSAWHSATLEP